MERESSSPAKPICANPHCERRDIRALGRCQACYVYLKRHGRDATPAEMHARGSERLCQNCRERPARARGRCQRCYQYWLRTGTERPSAGQRRSDGMCLNCGQQPAYRFGRCRSCYGYLSLYHKDRPGE